MAAKTALDLSPDAWQDYRPGIESATKPDPKRWERAMDVARQAAVLLRETYGAKRVLIFGSLVHPERFTAWSDIDLAVVGIPAQNFYRAVAVVTGLSEEFEIDVVAVEDCRSTFREVIQREGVAV